jgi:poly-beta-hydroxyalkanoate depolymerase
VFNGSRFRAEIAPRIADFVLSNEPRMLRRWKRNGAATA